MTSLLHEACEWASSLTIDAIPLDVRRLAIAQALSAAGARAATRRHPVHERLERAVDGSGWPVLAASDALLTMALDFDETAFAGHLGHAVTAVAMRSGVEAGATGERVLVAMVAASEIAARLTASVTLGISRGQTAAHTHAVAATIAAGLVLGLSVEELTTAISRVIAQPHQLPLSDFMGSDAKFWVAAHPILDAAKAVRVAGDGPGGPASVLEAPGGFFETLSDVPLPQAFSGYGERWHLRTLSVKPVPGCAYLTAAVEAAASLGPLPLEEVESVTVAASIFTLGMEAESASFIDGPRSPLPALSFCTGYNVAAALARGGLDVHDLHGADLADPARWRVARLVRLEHDSALSLRALSGTAPVGAAIAWAGARALPYLVSRGAPPDLAQAVLDEARRENPGDLAANSKRVGARLRVTLRDGSVLEAGRDSASGSCQESVDARVDLASAKLRRQLAAGGVPTGEIQARVDSHLALETLTSSALLALVAAG